jgi:nicotinamide mononucleotide adenylyltransferase
MTSMFVNEGGVAGHMSHLYDNPALTFKQMKEIFIAASQGELEGTEKTDGQNLYISYSVKDGKAKAARNKGNIKKGGLDAAGLAAKFAGRGSVEQAFNDAFSVFEKAVQSLPAETQEKIFGPDANIYYNAEIQDPRNANVINYDTKNLTIHHVGHAYFNKESGQVEDIDVSENFNTLRGALVKMQEAVAKEEFGLMVNPIRKLDRLSDETLNRNLAALEQTISRVGISDNDSILDYLVARIAPMVEESFGFLPDEAKSLLTKRFATGQKSGEYSATKLKTMVPAEQRPAFAKMVKEADAKFRKAAIAPLENIVHDFTVDVLEGLQSLFILDNSKEVARLKGEVANAIQAIEASGHEEAMEILRTQLEKLKSADRVTTAAEGFVFDWNGSTYKFTGNFAPINQILGMFKYGRGKIPALSTLAEQESQEKIVAVIPGGFKPPHRGHMDMVSHYAGIADEVIVYVSPKSREANGVQVTSEQAKQIFDLYAKALGLRNVRVEESPSASPVTAAYKHVEEVAKPGEKVLLGTSTKGGDQSRFAKSVQNYAAEGVEVLDPMKYAFDPQPPELSATDFREAISKGEDITPFIPQGVDPSEVLEILGNDQSPSSESSLDEMSAMGAGAVAGYAGPVGEEDKNRTIYREMQENYFIKREDLMEEIKLRKAIRKIITENKKKELNEEQRLRKVIRRMLTEAKQADEVVYQSTGINKLRDLLKNIIPTIQDDYKDLTTSLEQRQAYSNHLMIGIKNLLGIADISKSSEVDPAANLELEEEIEIDVTPEDPSKMDLGLDKEEEPVIEPEDSRTEEEKLVTGDEMPTDPDELTGMREAAVTLKKIQTQILNTYETLSNPEDEKAFKDYILPNIDAHLKDQETEITPAPEMEVEDPVGSVEVEEPMEEPEPEVEDQLDLSEDLLHKLTSLL